MEENRWYPERTGSTGRAASATRSYHNGGVEGQGLSDWYEEWLAAEFMAGNCQEDGGRQITAMRHLEGDYPFFGNREEARRSDNCQL
ncbi:hypothetical protein [Primorskyibacter sp. S87]|uniref:hypothetical protein n=1 Tax=Primorskyibacter sp. S87 TaxID=3415126 RepID=UPI003C7C02F0